MPTLRYNIRARRKERGLRQQDIAEALGIQKHNISCWERGEYKPSDQHLADLCGLLDCQPSDLIELDTANQK